VIFVPIVLLAAVALAPLALTLRRRTSARGRRDSALAVHRAQLAELDRDLAEGRIQPSEHASAVLEVQRRLLAAADAPDDITGRVSRAPLLAALVVVPLAGLGLYFIDGQPELPAAPLAARRAEAAVQNKEAEGLIATLRQKLALMDPKSDVARNGYVLLGNSEESLGHHAEAAAAWRMALAAGFNATLAAEAAEAQTRADGRVSEASAALFRQALAAAPADAEWRAMVQQRLSEVGE
jgi:cytochrome c-type biogenesis protein CcmH